jgi:peptidoglycan/LPS O-acetylase OafA/YrhL
LPHLDVADEPRATREDRLPALDGLRGLAALLVLVHHSWVASNFPAVGGGAVRDVISAGFLAVNFFFVLSGFVLFLPAARGAGSLGARSAYVIRRIARIVPAYWLALVLAIVLFPLLAPAGRTFAETVTPESVFAHFTFTELELRFLPGYQGPLGFVVDHPVWTLAVEMSFYALLPFIARRWFQRPFLGLWLAVAISCGLRIWFSPDEQLLSLPPVYLADFAFGMTAAWLYVRRDALRRYALPLGLAAGLTLIVLMVVVGAADPVLVRDRIRHSALVSTAVPLLFAGVALAFAWRPPRVLAGRIARWLGAVSYALYLLHFIVINFLVNTAGFAHDGSTRAFLAILVVAAPISLAVAYASYRFVEEPARSRARVWLKSRSADPARQ